MRGEGGDRISGCASCGGKAGTTSPSGMHLPPARGHGAAPGGSGCGELPHIQARGSPQSPSARRLLAQQGAGEGDKEGTQARANLGYLEQTQSKWGARRLG